MKGDETFDRKKDSSIVWNADGNDIYYQGKTSRQVPVTEKITYYLNGREIAADQLAGKSGKVKIHIDYTNHVKYKNVYVPFAAVTGMAFANDTAKNIKIDNGSVVTEGKNTMVIGMAFPGLEDSLTTARNESRPSSTESMTKTSRISWTGSMSWTFPEASRSPWMPKTSR